MNIISGKIKSAQKIVVYGPEGIGKTTFASKFPDPLFIDTEGGTKHLDVKRTEKPGSFMMLLEQVRYVVDHPDVCGTLVIDTIDWAEKMCIEQVCINNKKSGIESFLYGKGYVYVYELFQSLLTVLDDVIKRGIHVVLTAHASIRKFEQPDELGAYDRWELKLIKKVAQIVKEWSDMLLFANYKTFVINVDGQGADKGKNKASGGKRVLFTTHMPTWDAKNRYDLPDEVPFDYASIQAIIDDNTPGKQPGKQDQADQAEYTHEEIEAIINEPDDGKNPFVDEDETEEFDDPDFTEIGPNDRPVPMNLGELMRHCQVTEDEIRQVVNDKGYYPYDTPISNYDPDFVAGVLVGAWGQVFDMIKAERANKAQGEQVAI